MPWTLVFNDTFQRSDTVLGGAGSTNIGNGWIDIVGNEWTISNNRLVATGTAFFSWLARPASEIGQDQKISTLWRTTYGQQNIQIRSNLTSNSTYVLQVSQNPKIQYLTGNGTSADIQGIGSEFTPQNNIDYLIEFSAQGVNPTTLTVTYTDTATNVVAYTTSVTDSTAAVQGDAGRFTLGHFGDVQYVDVKGYIWTVDSGAVPVELPVTDTKYYRSPYNWSLDNVNGFIKSNNPGAYVRTKFTGSTTVSIQCTSPDLNTNGALSSEYPFIRYSLNQKEWLVKQITSANATISLATGLSSSTTYELELYIDRTLNGKDRWETPIESVQLGKVLIDNGGTFSAPTQRTKNAIIFGDSITEGQASISSNESSAVHAYSPILATSLGVEYGQVGFGGQGWNRTGAGGVPFFTTTWDKYWSNNSRLVSGLFTPLPDFVIVNHGTNDAIHSVTDSTIRTVVEDWLVSARAAAGSNCWILVVVPFGGFKATALSDAVVSYLANNPTDTKTKFINLGTEAAKGISAGALGSSLYATDGIHPLHFSHMRIASQLSGAIAKVTNTTDRTGTTALASDTQRFGVSLQSSSFALVGSVFDVSGTKVTILDSSGNFKSYTNGASAFLNTTTVIPAFSAFQILPKAEISVQNTQFSFGSLI